MEKEHLIFGIRAIIEAIQSGKEVDKVFIQKEISGELMKDLMKVMKRANVNFSYVPVEKLNRLTPNNHQGAVASISPIGFIDLEHLVDATVESGKVPLFLILDQISDARNFGAIIRTAECTGVNGIIVQKAGSAPVNGDTVKTSAGAVFNVPICKVEHIKDAIFYLQGSGIKTVAATEKTDQNIYDVDLKEGVADKLPAAALTAGAFILTPRFMARAATNKDAVNALAGLAKGAKDPAFGGAAAAKFIDQLNKSGVIDSEYMNEVDALFGPTRQQTTPQVEQRINWNEVVTQ